MELLLAELLLICFWNVVPNIPFLPAAVLLLAAPAVEEEIVLSSNPPSKIPLLDSSDEEVAGVVQVLSANTKSSFLIFV